MVFISDIKSKKGYEGRCLRESEDQKKKDAFPCRKGSLWTWCGRRGSGVRPETRRSRGGTRLFQASEMIPGVPAKGSRALPRANPYLSRNRRAYRDVEFLLIHPESPDKLGHVVPGLLLL